MRPMTITDVSMLLSTLPGSLPVLVEAVHEPMFGCSYIGHQYLLDNALTVQANHELVGGPALVIDARVDLDQLPILD